ncbi:MAG: cytochrome c oxidase subunit II [Bryobacteraceae bacterium]
MNSLNLLPPTASTYATQVNYLFWVMVAVCGVVTLGITVFIVYCVIKYRRKYADELPPQITNNYKVETAWTVIPLLIFLGMFGWGAKEYFYAEEPPAHTINIFVVGKQWMWTIEHANGIREINTLHIPIDTPIRLTLISQDVIHDFYVPAFRTKQDVLPDRYTTEWFKATSAGKYHLFCSEYCGTGHSGMIGWIYAMNPHDYQLWLEQGAGEGSLASQGEKLFHQFGCANCHRSSGHGPGPDLRGLYGTEVQLTSGAIRRANAAYIRECIMGTKGGLVFGFSNIMPNFTGQINELQVLALVSYIKSIGPEADVNQPSGPGTNPARVGFQPGIAGPGSSSIAGTKPDTR